MRYILPLLLLIPWVADAGTVMLTPSAWTGAVGERVTLSVYADSEGVPVTAVEAEIQYNPALLTPVAVSTAGSAFSLWATEPDLSVPGTIPLSGWAARAQTGSLKVADIIFTVRAGGTQEVLVSSGALLANDGKGSNVLTALGRAELSAEVSQMEGQVLGVSTTEQAPLPPQFQVYAERAGDRLVITGTSDTDARVVMTLTSARGSETLKADAPHGSFAIVGDRLEPGEYRLRAETYVNGVVSKSSDETVFRIREEPQLVAAAFLGAPSYLTVLVGLVSFAIGFLLYRLLLLLSVRRR